MPLFSTNVNSAITHITIYGSIGFMYHTNLIFEKINRDLEGLASTTNSDLLTLRDCMRDIQNECTNCDQQVKDMREALILAERAQSFDEIDVAEMKEVCQTLLNVFQVLAGTNERVNNQGDLFNTRLSEIAKRFDTSRKLYQWKYGAMGGIVGGMLTGYTLGALIGVCMTQFGKYCTSYSKNHTEIILRKFFVDANKIKYTTNGSIDTLGDIVNRLEAQLDSAGKNDRTKAALGIRVKKQVEQMITDIYLVRNALYTMKKKAQVNEHYVENILKLENVVDLLKL